MYCAKCGTKIPNEESIVCINCGCSLEKNNIKKIEEPDESKTGIGVLLGLFLGVVGLLIGICLYKEGTIARKTFVKSWLITYLSLIAAIVLVYILFIIILITSFSASTISAATSILFV